MFESQQPVLTDHYDVVVIGGGPAGASTGALTAEHGHRTLILERSDVPRFHVGESLIPETYWTLQRLGLVERLRDSAYPRKYSVQFFSEGMKPSAPFYFDEYKNCESSQTWQVWRDTFDQMLLERAVELGATVHTQAQVIDAHFDGDRATGVRVRTAGPDSSRVDQDISCRVIVDATGQSAFLASRLGLKDTDPALKKGTIWTYFKDARRDPGKDEGATLIMQTAEKQSWFWFIPLPDNVTSIGCTADMDVLFPRGLTAEESFQRELNRCPAMVERLKNATRVRDYLKTKDYSYYARQGAGPGWMLVGDAYGFIDPVYSSGVFLALKSGEFAADAIHEAFETQDFSTEQLGSWQDIHAKGVDVFRKLVYAFYNPTFSFGRFLKMHPEFRSHVTDILIGDVFKRDFNACFESMGDVTPPVSA
ncbi:MAG: NAD(P)/FAD-dependent oxidoreductase [Planctomycetota bacterium]|nr:NAD(P)/FAD-dependent oxidoreductase [Planctomycetota bacterium]MDA1162355.1 NAD(P)/FAD-dependent oxidoreductase [Planctomycetota bacterium]